LDQHTRYELFYDTMGNQIEVLLPTITNQTATATVTTMHMDHAITITTNEWVYHGNNANERWDALPEDMCY
jgi:hypothetical protein